MQTISINNLVAPRREVREVSKISYLRESGKVNRSKVFRSVPCVSFPPHQVQRVPQSSFDYMRDQLAVRELERTSCTSNLGSANPLTTWVPRRAAYSARLNNGLRPNSDIGHSLAEVEGV